MCPLLPARLPRVVARFALAGPAAAEGIWQMGAGIPGMRGGGNGRWLNRWQVECRTERDGTPKGIRRAWLEGEAATTAAAGGNSP